MPPGARDLDRRRAADPPTSQWVRAADRRRPRPPTATVSASVVDRRVGDAGQIHAPSGTRCSSPHRLPRGRIFCGLARADGIERVAQAGLGVEVVGPRR